MTAQSKIDPTSKRRNKLGVDLLKIDFVPEITPTGKLGVLAKLIVPEKEVILIVTKESQTDTVFDAVIKAGKLDKKGQGFAYIHKIDRAIGFLEDFSWFVPNGLTAMSIPEHRICATDEVNESLRKQFNLPSIEKYEQDPFRVRLAILKLAGTNLQEIRKQQNLPSKTFATF